MKQALIELRALNEAGLSASVTSDAIKKKIPSLYSAMSGELGEDIVIEGQAELSAFVAFAINASITNGNIKSGVIPMDVPVADLMNSLTARHNLSQPGFLSALFDITSSIATHNIRVNHPDNDTGRFVARVNAPKHGITSYDVTRARRYYYIGAPSLLRNKNFWCAQAVRNNQPFTMLDALANRDAELLNLFSDWDVPVEVVTQLIEVAERVAGHHIPDFATSNQVLLPIDDEGDEPGYLAVTPLPATSVQESLKKAILGFNRANQEQFRRVNYGTYIVGGGNPVNTGDFSSGNGGSHYALKGGIPNIFQNNDLVVRIKEGRSLWHFINERAEGINKSLVSFHHRTIFERRMSEYLDHLLADIMQARAYWHHLSDEERAEHEFHGHSELNKACYLLVTTNKLDAKQIEYVSTLVFNEIKRVIVKKNKKEDTWSNDQQSIASMVIFSTIRGIGR